MRSFTDILSDMSSPALSLKDAEQSVSSESGKWIMDNTFKIGWNCQELFEWFFNVNEVPVSEMPDFCCIPMMCEIHRNFRFRYRVVVDSDGIGYLCLVKRRDPVGRTPRYGLSYRILPSEKGRPVDGVLDLWKRAGVGDVVSIDEDDVFQRNYYNNREDAARYVRRKWQTRHGVHMLDGRIQVLDSGKGDDVFVSEEVASGFRTLIDGWYGSKHVSGKSIDLSVPSLSKDIFRTMVFLVDGKVAGYCAITKMCGHWFSMMNKNASRIGWMDEYAARRIGHYITWYRHNEFLKDEEAEGLFCFGTHRDDTKLKQWKKMSYGHSVPYSRKKI